MVNRNSEQTKHARELANAARKVQKVNKEASENLAIIAQSKGLEIYDDSLTRPTLDQIRARWPKLEQNEPEKHIQIYTLYYECLRTWDISEREVVVNQKTGARETIAGLPAFWKYKFKREEPPRKALQDGKESKKIDVSSLPDIKKGKQLRNACLTVHGIDPENPFEYMYNLSHYDMLKYLIAGLEFTGTGGLHNQTFSMYHNPVTLRTIFDKIGKIAYAREMYNKSKPSFNIRYCSKGMQTHDDYMLFKDKGGTYGHHAVTYFYGEIPDDERTYRGKAAMYDASADRLKKIKELAALGGDIDKAIRCQNAFQHLRPVLEQPPCEWFFGPNAPTYLRQHYLPGIGIDPNNPEECYVAPAVNNFSMYDGQDVVVLSILDISKVVIADLYKLVCLHSEKINTKGGHVNRQYSKIYIASRTSPLPNPKVDRFGDDHLDGIYNMLHENQVTFHDLSDAYDRNIRQQLLNDISDAFKKDKQRQDEAAQKATADMDRETDSEPEIENSSELIYPQTFQVMYPNAVEAF